MCMIGMLKMIIDHDKDAILSRPFEIYAHVWMILGTHKSKLEISWKYFHNP